MTAVLSNQKIIDEIRDIQDSYIKTRPKMEMSVFKPTRFGEYNLGDERGGRHHLNMAMRQGLSMIHPLAPAAANLFINKSHGGMMGSGSPAFQKHPLSYGNINGNTLHPDPLYSGVVYQKYKNTKGGALLEKSMPLTGESESDTDSGSESDEGGDIMSESSEGEFSSDEEGELGGRRKPAGKISNLVKTRQMAPAKGGSKIGDIAKQAGQAIYKVINTAEAKGLAEGAIKTAIMGVLTAYFGPTGTTVGAVGLNEIDKLRKQFGNKDKGRGIVDNIKGATAAIKRKAKQASDAIYKAVVSKEAQMLGAAGLMLLITGLIGKYGFDNKEKIMDYMRPRSRSIDEDIQYAIPLESHQKLEYITPNDITSHKLRGEPQQDYEYGLPDLEDDLIATPKEKSIIDIIVDSVVDNKSISEAVSKIAKPTISQINQVTSLEGHKPPAGRTREEKNRPAISAFRTINEQGHKPPAGRTREEKYLEEELRYPEEMLKEPEVTQVFENEYLNHLLGHGHKKRRGQNAGRLVKKIVGTKRGESARGAIVAEVMRKKGLTLAQASKYVKEKGLY